MANLFDRPRVGGAPAPTRVCHTPGFARLSRRSFVAGAAAAVGVTACSPHVPPAPTSPVVFTNAMVFDGTSNALLEGARVIVEGARISAIDRSGAPVAEGVQVIDCGGRTLMPGLIDAHWHAMMAAMPASELQTADASRIAAVAFEEAGRTLLRGFTTIRDLAGPSFALKRAIDAGETAGPRIYPSGAMITQTGGHGDFRTPAEIPAAPNAPLSRGEVLGFGAIADGVGEVLKRAREQLMLGATQLKLAAGGGVASTYDPIDLSQYTEAEFRAAVDAAENWGTYVTAHAYTPRAIQTAIRGGVRCIDHGQLMDEQTARIMADRGVWLSTQAFLANEFSNPMSTPEARAKQQQVAAGTDMAYGLARLHNLKTAWGTDMLFNPGMTANQGAILATLRRWYAPVDILKMATGANAELVAMCGPRNPYPGKLGVIEAGAYADLLLVDGDPTADIGLVADPERNFKIIMKDGRIYKNTLA